MKVENLVSYLDYGCDGNETQMKVEVRGWYNGKMVIHYLRDYDKQEPQIPETIEQMEVEHAYAKESGYFVIDVAM